MTNAERRKYQNNYSISHATSDEEIGEFWDEHDTADYWEQTYPVECTINLDPKSQVRYYGIDRNLSDQISAIAKHKGISVEKLFCGWRRN